MSSQKTTNYDLNQWLPDDSVLRTDFNADNAKIDAALQTLSDGKADQGALEALEDRAGALEAAAAHFGNCQAVFGSYTGTGTYGSDAPNTLTFAHKPLLVAIMPETTQGQSVILGFWAVRGSTFLYTSEYFQSRIGLTWQDKALSWAASDAGYQYNSSGSVYHYVALLSRE